MQVTDEMVDAGLRITLSSVGLPAGECLHATDVREILTAALSDKQAGEVKIKPLEDLARKLCDDLISAWLHHHSRDEASSIALAALRDASSRSALVDVPAVEPVAWMIEWRFKASGSDIKFPGGGSKVLWGHDASKAAADTEASRLSAIDTVDWVSCRPLYTSPPLSREGENAKAEQYWSTVEQLANCEDEIFRLRVALDEIATDDEYRDLSAEEAKAVAKRALAATRSGSATTASGGHHAGEN